jgi:hypothetical protein
MFYLTAEFEPATVFGEDESIIQEVEFQTRIPGRVTHYRI